MLTRLSGKRQLFNATIETHFDSSIDKVDLLPQDIGRVLLNLYTTLITLCSRSRSWCWKGQMVRRSRLLSDGDGEHQA
jgi:hypothetical protein